MDISSGSCYFRLMEQRPGPDERRLKRLKKPFVLRLQRQSASEEWDFVLVDDISKSGVRFRTELSYLEGEVLNLKLYMRGELPTVVCRGEVVRSAPLGHIDVFEAALVFVDLSEEDGELIERTVEENKRDGL